MQRLIEQIDVFRKNHINVVVDHSEEVDEFTETTKSLSLFFNYLNELKLIDKAFDRLNIGEYDQISILEIFKVLTAYYKDVNKSKILSNLRLMDNKVQGFISYEKFNILMKKYLENYESSCLLHLKYLSKKIIKQHKSFKEYLIFKNLSPNTNLKESEFYQTFKEELFKDEELSNRIFEYLKEDSGIHVGNLMIQNLIDFLTFSFSSKLIEDTNIDSDKNNIPIESILEILENSNIPLNTIYNEINFKQINQYGKIHTDNITNVLKKKFLIKEEVICKFTNFFSSLNTLFDLNKLADFLQNNSHISVISVKEISIKIKTFLQESNYTNLNLFLTTFNLKLYEPYSLNDVFMIFPTIFKISLYGKKFNYFRMLYHQSRFTPFINEYS